MNTKSISRSQTFQTIGLLISTLCLTSVTTSDTPELLLKAHNPSNSTSGIVPKILKLSPNGNQEIIQATDIVGEPQFTLKSDPVRVQSDFQTVDINVLNRQREREKAKKVAIIQEDLQSRIKIHEPELTTKAEVKEIKEPEVDPEEVIKKQAQVKKDIESRVLSDDSIFSFRQESGREEKFQRRSDDDYYADEPEPAPESRTTEAPKEEESFFSIFESLFGSSDEESQTKKKAKPEDDSMFKDPEEASIKENIKTVGSLLKPLRPIDKPEPPVQNAFGGYQNNVPEYRIVNNYHASQTNKQIYKPDKPPAYHNFYRPTEKPFRPYKPHSTNGYEDYDLEEFMDKGDMTTKVKYVSPAVATTSTQRYQPSTTVHRYQSTSTSTHRYQPSSSTTTTTTTTTTVRTTPKISYDNKLKFPSVQKKNDYINRNRYQEIKSEPTERTTEKVTYQKPEIKSTTEVHYFSRPNHENKDSDIKTHKIHESPNFYNLINLPVRYSTKDTAIPLISTSYANTKIQGMGALKYEKGSNGKYPNHKYDQVTTSSSTQRPNYWATKRTSTEDPSTFKPSLMISKTTVKYVPGSDLDKIDYDEMAEGMGPALGSYGSKTGVEVKTQTPEKPGSTTSFYRETTTKRNEVKTSEASYQGEKIGFHKEPVNIASPEKTKPNKETYEEYDYDSYLEEQESRPGGSIANQNYPPNYFNQNSENEYKTQYSSSYNIQNPSTMTSMSEGQRPPEGVEYEYYDYDVDPSTTTTTKKATTSTTTSTTPKYKIKYPSVTKDKIKTSSEKVAVVVPVKDTDLYNDNQVSASEVRTSTVVITSTPSTTTTTTTTTPTTTTTTSTKQPQTATEIRTTENEIQDHYKKTTQYYKPNQVYKEPAPVFEDIKDDLTTKQVLTTSTTKRISERPITTTTTVKPVIVTSSSTEQEPNANIVLVPTKETIKNVNTEVKFSQPAPHASEPVQKVQPKPQVPQKSSFDYTTEFTVGAVHGGNVQNKIPPGQGHFVATSISTNPYGDDEPFRPIPKPPGMTSSFTVVHEEPKRPPPKAPVFHQKHPHPSPVGDTEPAHEPHEFIPSPQFHRPVEPKPSIPLRPGSDIDYDFEGIQTEPKPGQYVIFSKPQLNPEMNENQLKKRPEVNTPTRVSNVPHYNEKINPHWQESQKHVVFNPSEGQIYQSVSKPKPERDQSRPVFGNIPEDDRLPLELVPPRGGPPEKFEGNFVLPEEKQESTVNYPRPHWEKNTKPSFLNTLSNKNDMIGSRHPPMPPQMAPTLIPPSSIPPQRFRRPPQPHMPPLRKNFNEAGTNIKPKPNLPNILPQFRPNTKVGSGPYHRPPGYHNSNRRNGMNRYHDKDHGNFPYHIQHPDKDSIHREFEGEPEVIPKFITNRGKLPNEMWNSQGMQKRYGQGPQHHEEIPPQRILKRHQRTPVTTLQKLKQMPGVQTQKTQVREDIVESSVPLVPPLYKTFVDQPKNENVYIVYPARAPQKLHTDDPTVFIVSDTKSKKNFYNVTKADDSVLVHPVNTADKPKNGFPYGFNKGSQRRPIKRKETPEKPRVEEPKQQPIVIPPKDDKIDMSLHMQSNNQWNEVKPQESVSFGDPAQIIRGDHYRFSDNPPVDDEIQRNPPSEYHTSIKDDSAFTLGAVMHTVSEGNRKGQVASIPLQNDDEVNIPKLNVNERISNGKIVTVSMPLDVKQDPNEKETQYQFQAPFQPSSSLTSNGSQPISQGWSIVKSPDEETESEDGKTSTEKSTTSFDFENFKPELIGGFKPIFELPEEPEVTKKEEKKEKETR